MNTLYCDLRNRVFNEWKQKVQELYPEFVYETLWHDKASVRFYLKEKPLFPLQYVKLSEVPEEYARGRITSNEVTGDAFRRSKRVSGGAFRRSKRVRGLPLVTNVFQMMDYARLKELATKDVLTPEEIKEVDGMYRRP